MVYLYSIELFPTKVRGIALGIVEVGGRIGGMVAPQTEGLPPAAGQLLLGALAVGGGLLLCAVGLVVYNDKKKEAARRRAWGNEMER